MTVPRIQRLKYVMLVPIKIVESRCTIRKMVDCLMPETMASTECRENMSHSLIAMIMLLLGILSIYIV